MNASFCSSFIYKNLTFSLIFYYDFLIFFVSFWHFKLVHSGYTQQKFRVQYLRVRVRVRVWVRVWVLGLWVPVLEKWNSSMYSLQHWFKHTDPGSFTCMLLMKYTDKVVAGLTCIDIHRKHALANIPSRVFIHVCHSCCCTTSKEITRCVRLTS